MRITIIGAGAFGTALESILRENGHKISFFDPYKFPNISLGSALENSDAIVFSAPSKTAKETIKNLPESAKKLPFICASKGFLTDEIFKNLEIFSVLSGPSFSKDILAKKPTTLTVTSHLTKDLFETTWLKFEISRDIKGVLLCGSLKNIYSIYSGAHNIKPATPDFREFLTESIKEFKKILKTNNCNPNTAELACGFKDLALTASSTNSRNYRLGQKLAKHGSAYDFSETTEGLSAVHSLNDSKLIIPENLPILNETISLVNANTLNL